MEVLTLPSWSMTAIASTIAKSLRSMPVGIEVALTVANRDTTSALALRTERTYQASKEQTTNGA